MGEATGMQAEMEGEAGKPYSTVLTARIQNGRKKKRKRESSAILDRETKINKSENQ